MLLYVDALKLLYTTKMNGTEAMKTSFSYYYSCRQKRLAPVASHKTTWKQGKTMHREHISALVTTQNPFVVVIHVKKVEN